MYAFLYADAFTMCSAIEPAGSADAAADGIADGVAVARGVGVGVGEPLLVGDGVALDLPVADAVGVLVAAVDGATLPPDGASGAPPPPLQASSVNVSNNSARFIATQICRGVAKLPTLQLDSRRYCDGGDTSRVADAPSSR
jgi:hypothetical protein